MLVIDDDILKAAGWTESQARVEVAVALFRAGKLPVEAAARLAEMEPVAFSEELIGRGIAVYTLTPQELEEDYLFLGQVLAKQKQAS